MILEEENVKALAVLLLWLPIAIAILSRLFVSRLILQTPCRVPIDKTNQQNEPNSKDLTFRVEDLPLTLSREDLQIQLRAMKHEAPERLKNGLKSLEVCSMARKDTFYNSATVVIHTSLGKTEILQALKQGLRVAGLKYRCDFDFHGVTPLQEHSGKTHICDVIAVPGLASHALGSWKAPGSSDVWLRDWLPKDVASVRTLLYGYDTKLLKNDSVSSIEDLGKSFYESLKSFRRRTDTESRPIIFVGHSLGGLLIKEALTYSYKSTSSHTSYGSALHKQCCGILFFGVPHLGLRNDVLSTIVNGRPNQALITSIVVDNESEPSHFLKRISDDFARCFPGERRIVSFYERLLSPSVVMHDGQLEKNGKELLMVTQKSATSTGVTGISEEDIIPVEADHSGLVKFPSTGTYAYEVARDRIDRFVFESIQRANSSNEDTTRGSTSFDRDVTSNPQQHFVYEQGGSTFSGNVSASNGAVTNQGNHFNVSRN